MPHLVSDSSLGKSFVLVCTPMGPLMNNRSPRVLGLKELQKEIMGPKQCPNLFNLADRSVHKPAIFSNARYWG